MDLQRRSFCELRSIVHSVLSASQPAPFLVKNECVNYFCRSSSNIAPLKSSFSRFIDAERLQITFNYGTALAIVL